MVTVANIINAKCQCVNMLTFFLESPMSMAVHLRLGQTSVISDHALSDTECVTSPIFNVKSAAHYASSL